MSLGTTVITRGQALRPPPQYSQPAAQELLQIIRRPKLFRQVWHDLRPFALEARTQAADLLISSLIAFFSIRIGIWHILDEEFGGLAFWSKE